MPAPICLFTYNRLNETRQTVEALKRNYLAAESELFVFSDGPKNGKSYQKVAEVRDFLKTITGFKTIQITESPVNRGLADSIISGVSQVIQKFGQVIVLEDDLITSPNFLIFMNQALEFYKSIDRIFSISGYTLDLPSLKNNTKDYYLGYRASSWGWGTWSTQWEKVDWDMHNFNSVIFNPWKHLKFLRGGSDLSLMLWRQKKGKIDSWAVRWCFHQFNNELFTVFPVKSKVISIGFGENATHTKKTGRFDVQKDDGKQKLFVFDNDLIIDKVLIKEFRQKFSIVNRFKDKFRK